MGWLRKDPGEQQPRPTGPHFLGFLALARTYAINPDEQATYDAARRAWEDVRHRPVGSVSDEWIVERLKQELGLYG